MGSPEALRAMLGRRAAPSGVADAPALRAAGQLLPAGSRVLGHVDLVLPVAGVGPGHVLPGSAGDRRWTRRPAPDCCSDPPPEADPANADQRPWPSAPVGSVAAACTRGGGQSGGVGIVPGVGKATVPAATL